MRLYKIKTHFYGKDLNEEAILGYTVADNETGIYDHINKKFKYDGWPDSVMMTQEEIIIAKGDYDSEYMGEFYDQKYGWEDLGEISGGDFASLVRLKIVS
ncbi:MAG: hypothetical protein Q8P07_01160 [bacterium]|nr:hypothetical protein [bacterium]